MLIPVIWDLAKTSRNVFNYVPVILYSYVTKTTGGMKRKLSDKWIFSMPIQKLMLFFQMPSWLTKRAFQREIHPLIK